MIDINRLKLHDFIKNFESGEFYYSDVEGHADYYGWHIIFFKEKKCNNVSAVSFDDILFDEKIKNIADKILQKIKLPIRFGNNFFMIKDIWGIPDFSDSIFTNMIRYHYFSKKRDLYLCFGVDCNDSLCSLEVITNIKIINDRFSSLKTLD